MNLQVNKNFMFALDIAMHATRQMLNFHAIQQGFTPVRIRPAADGRRGN
ncbi:hypothetical protein [Rhodanobacter sp. DHB23]|nr:hypothetical protein [Rhodanobacter sp. DHB23]MBD8873250.1 hypothetical protein [Rhodanobacter sp. DHB23]